MTCGCFLKFGWKCNCLQLYMRKAVTCYFFYPKQYVHILYLGVVTFCSLYWILMGAETCFTKCTMIPRPPPPDKNPGRNPSHYSGKWYYYHNTRHVWVSNNFSKPFRSILQAIVSKIAEKRFWKLLETQTLRHLHRLPATTIPALYCLIKNVHQP